MTCCGAQLIQEQDIYESWSEPLACAQQLAQPGEAGEGLRIVQQLLGLGALGVRPRDAHPAPAHKNESLGSVAAHTASGGGKPCQDAAHGTPNCRSSSLLAVAWTANTRKEPAHKSARVHTVRLRFGHQLEKPGGVRDEVDRVNAARHVARRRGSLRKDGASRTRSLKTRCAAGRERTKAT